MASRPAFLAVALALGALVLSTGAAAQPQDAPSPFDALDWQVGPHQGKLGGVASVAVPAGYRFLGKGSAGKFMELLQNPSDGSELGVLVPTEGSWFVVFEFSEDGYVKDDERDLDADAILDSIRRGTEEANKVRTSKGWGTVHVDGWQQKPYYDAASHNLAWGIYGRSDDGRSVNHSTRLLGRRGVMRVNLVAAPEELDQAVPALNTVLQGFSFNPGQRYAEFTRGDKVAEYGLTGLIVGGAGVALVKTGLLQKFWKLIVFAFIAAAGALKKLFSRPAQTREADESRGV